MRNQKGFTLRETIIILLVVAGIAVAGGPVLKQLRARQLADEAALHPNCTVTITPDLRKQVFECDTEKEVDELIKKTEVCLRSTTGLVITSRAQGPIRGGRYVATLFIDPAGTGESAK